MEEKKVELNIPEVKMVPIKTRETVLGEDGNTYEIEKTIMMPDFPSEKQNTAVERNNQSSTNNEVKPVATLKEVKENLIQQVIATVVAVIAEKGQKSIDEIKIDGNPLQYTGDIGILISALVEMHEIFDLEFNQDLNLVKERFLSIESRIEYFMIRLVDEKL